MRLKPLKFLPPGGDARGLVPWVIAVMVYLCGLAMVLGLSLNGALSGWSADLERKVTVEVSLADPDEQRRIAQNAAAVLRATPGIARAEILPQEAVLSLLEPWLGANILADDLPIPTLIDVTLTGQSLDLRAVRARLSANAPGAVLNDHGQWLAPVLDLSLLLQTLALAVAGMVLLATVAVVIFGTRAGLASHRASVEIMHLMGAEDRVIAGEFQIRYLRHGLLGGLGGTLLCLLTVLALGHLVQSLGGGLMAGLSFQPAAIAILVAMPVIAALLTTLTARVTVLRALERLY